VKFADDGPYYVEMDLPKYNQGSRPPWFGTRRIRDPETGKVIRHERAADRDLWIEVFPESDIRNSYKVKE